MKHSTRRTFLCGVVALSLPIGSQAQVPEKCVSTIAGLKQLLDDPAFPLKWEETTMDDGKPLMVTISEKNGLASVEFVKREKGLWADISGQICQAGTDLEIRFTAEQIHFGPAASWVLRYVMGSGGKFVLTRLGPKQLRVATTGWSGIFVPTDS